MQQIDYTFAILIGLGSLLLLVGTIWLLVQAFRESLIWGLLCLFVPGVSLLFLLIHFRKAIGPTLLQLLGVGLCLSPVYNIIFPPPIQDTAQAEIKQVKDETGQVQTELRLTLTGAKREEYQQLAQEPNYAVVQWANADVTDDDAEQLKLMRQIREIDLNSSQITDRTLKMLAELKTLEVVRVANTKATAAGVEEHLLSLPNLKELDVRGLKVPGKRLREWKAQDQQNRKFAN